MQQRKAQSEAGHHRTIVLLKSQLVNLERSFPEMDRKARRLQNEIDILQKKLSRDSSPEIERRIQITRKEWLDNRMIKRLKPILLRQQILHLEGKSSKVLELNAENLKALELKAID